MQRYLLFVLFTVLIIAVPAREIFSVPQGNYNPKTYTAFTPISQIVIDGRLDDESWRLTHFSDSFVDIEGDLKPEPLFSTRFKLLWDSEALYIGAELIEPHIWATLTERDAVIFHDNDFEVFIDPDGDTHDYYELEINALGTLWDLFLIKPYRDRQQVAINAWDIREIEYAIHIDGSLNDPSDTDRAWYVEMKIPMSVLAECAHKEIPPPEGDYWRLNFSRVHWETEVIDGQYHKIDGKPEYNWVWSPQGLIAMHYPERWGYLFFSHMPAGSADPGFQIPPKDHARAYLRELYYKQKQYFMDHGRYARSLRQLDARPYRIQGRKIPLRIETTSVSYVISLGPHQDLSQILIREDGLIWEQAR